MFLFILDSDLFLSISTDNNYLKIQKSTGHGTKFPKSLDWRKWLRVYRFLAADWGGS